MVQNTMQQFRSVTVIESNAIKHEKCFSISWFAINAIYQIAGSGLEFQETRDMEEVIHMP